MSSIFPTFNALLISNTHDMICDVSGDDHLIQAEGIRQAFPGLIVCRGKIYDNINGNTIPIHMTASGGYGYCRGDFISYNKSQRTLKVGKHYDGVKQFYYINVDEESSEINEDPEARFIETEMKKYGYQKYAGEDNTAILVMTFHGNQTERLILNDVHSLANNESLEISISSNTYLNMLTESASINGNTYPESSWIHVETDQTITLQANNEVLIGEFTL